MVGAILLVRLPTHGDRPEAVAEAPVSASADGAATSAPASAPRA
jgi:hypothetical protein